MMCLFFYIAGWADLLFHRVLNSWIKMENFCKDPNTCRAPISSRGGKWQKKQNLFGLSRVKRGGKPYKHSQ